MSAAAYDLSKTVSEAEWQARCDLAALYRLTHHYRMTDMIYTHLSARVPDEEGTFLINRYGEMFDEVTASSLVKMDMEGNVVGEPGAFNMAGFNIHSGIYGARPDVNCVMHTHTRAGVAVSASKVGLQPISQHALIIMNDVSYFDYTGPGTTETPEDIGRGDVIDFTESRESFEVRHRWSKKPVRRPAPPRRSADDSDESKDRSRRKKAGKQKTSRDESPEPRGKKSDKRGKKAAKRGKKKKATSKGFSRKTWTFRSTRN